MSRDGRLDLDDPQLNAGLGEAVGRFGSDLWTRPGLIRATLSDALGEAAISFRGEIDLLEQSAEVGLAAAVSASGPTDTVLAELRDAGIDPPVAEQLVGVWGRAVRRAPTTTPSTTPAPAVAPTTTPSTTAMAPDMGATILPDATTPASSPESSASSGPPGSTPLHRSAPPFIASIPSEPQAEPVGMPSVQPSPQPSPQPGAPLGAPTAPLGWATGTPADPPAANGSDKRQLLVIGGVAALIVVMAIAVGAYLLLRSDDKVVTTAGVSPGVTAVQAADTTTTTTTTPATTTTLALEPPTPAAIRGFFGARISGDCSDYPGDNLASVICIASIPGQPDHLTNFTSWGDVDSAVYAITHASDGETVLATAPWTAADGRTGATMDTVDTTTSYPYCRAWSYDGTEYTGEVCAPDAAHLSALLPTYQL